jgi:hypothetical protein
MKPHRGRIATAATPSSDPKQTSPLLHIAFICADPKSKEFTITQVRAHSMDEAWYLASVKMEEAGWPGKQKIILLGHVV